MKKILLAFLILTSSHVLFAQEEETPLEPTGKKVYRETYTRINDLVHTQLDIRFDYSKSQAQGKVWITLKPHFYATDSLNLDAKGMDIHSVGIMKGAKSQLLKYTYNGNNLFITLDKTYTADEQYVVYIEYTAKPNEYKTKGSMAITDAKGLYFINPLGTEKNKPTQIWTQGETEATSVWCPTIDKPNQKTTNEFRMTVPAKYVTLSNGRLVNQKSNTDGTRTDTWKMELPHAPYLFFMGVGDFAIVKDSYKGKEVSYYVEKEYAPVARGIFGYTPEMIAYFSRITGVDYPWVKYAQIVGRDYVSGAMENTTSTLHGESAQQDARELLDGNGWESTIAHELFHQWFGDYVTSESWSNLTLNESFANYSEVLWDEYKHGKDAADAQNYNDMLGYLDGASEKKDLVRFYYGDKEDMFDNVSYNKGGRILNMLRNYVGDSAFFKSLNLYLTTNKFKSAEAQQLRLAFEEVTGRDLNWYFNQWYYGSGHPKLTIDYVYNDTEGQAKVIIKQTQAGDKVFRLPIAIDIYNGSKKERKNVWVENRIDTFTFQYKQRPDLINVDGDKILLTEKKDNKTFDNYIFQYSNAGKYVDRREAIEMALTRQDDPKAQALLKKALKDPYHGLRRMVVEGLNVQKSSVKKEFEAAIIDVAKNDSKRTVKAAAISLLPKFTNAESKAIILEALKDSSYSVAGAALEAYAVLDAPAALTVAKGITTSPSKGALLAATVKVLIRSGDVSSFDYINNAFGSMPLTQEKFELLQPFCSMLGSINETDKLKSGVDNVVKFRNAIPEQYGVSPVINNLLKNVIKKKEAAVSAAENKTALQEQIAYLKEAVEGNKKQGF